MKQTAIDFLIEKFELTSNSPIIKNVIEQAKELEKQQIIDAWCCGNDSEPKEVTGHHAEQYFKDNYTS